MLVRQHVATDGDPVHFCLPPPQVKDEDLASETPRQKRDGPACCYNTGITGWAAAQGDTTTFSGAPKGKKDVRLFKRVSCFLFFLSSAEFPNRVIPVDNRLLSPSQTASCKGLPR